MSTLKSGATKLTYTISKFKGLNQSTEGGVNLKPGEATVCQDYKVTDGGALKVRGGFKHRFGGAHTSLTGTVRDMASGLVNGVEKLIMIIGDTVYIAGSDLTYSVIEDVLTSATTKTHIFFFGGYAYILDGNGGYFRYDGDTLTEVDGYIPTVIVAAEPSGSGTTYEQVNKLTTKRKVRYSADGTSTDYYIPEAGNVTVYAVSVNGTEQTLTTDYTFTQGTQYGVHAKVTFTSTPATGNSNVEILYAVTGTQVYRSSGYETASGTITFTSSGTPSISVTSVRGLNAAGTLWSDLTLTTDYTVNDNVLTLVSPSSWSVVRIYFTIGDYRSEVTGMKLSEVYNGAQDSRIFLYGDGTNKAIYSGLDEDGQATAEYFPDLNEMQVGDSNTPLTALIRHRSRLLAFKPHSAYSIYYNSVTLADSSLTAGFYISPINRDVGCSKLGAACLVGNRVRTIDYNNIYEWKSTTTSGNITADARNADVVSERVKTYVKGMNMSNVTLFYDNANHEFYCADSSTNQAVVQNTEADAWYLYTNLSATSMAYAFDKVWFGDSSGRVFSVEETQTQDTRYVTASGTTTETSYEIQADWRSGNIDFGDINRLKYTPMLWVTAVTAPSAEVGAIIIPDSATTYPSTDLSFSATTSYPKTARAKLKARKFNFLRIGFSTAETGSHAIILSAVMNVLTDTPIKR